MRKAIGTALAGSALAAATIVAAPIANASMHTITSVVYWSGIDCIPVRSPQYPDGRHLGLNTLCGGYSTKTYSAIPGEYIGADPMPFDMSRTVGCEVFIDGTYAYQDYARDGDHHDVNCLRILSPDYNPGGVQGMAL
jgi:hypothetical protein